MYTHIRNAEDLKRAISELEAKQQQEKEQLKENFHGFTESLKPMNLIKSSIHNFKNTPGIAGTVINASLGLGAGLLSKNLLIGPSTSVFKKLAGNAVKMGVAGIITKKSDKIKYAGLKWITKLLGKKKEERIIY